MFEKLREAEMAEKEREEKIKRDAERKEALEKESAGLRRDYIRLKEAFESEGHDFDNFETHPEFKRLMDDLDRKKDLVKVQEELKLIISQLLARIKILTAQKEVNCE